MIRVAQNGPPPHERAAQPQTPRERAYLHFWRYEFVCFDASCHGYYILLCNLRNAIYTESLALQVAELIFKICANFTLMRITRGCGVRTDYAFCLLDAWMVANNQAVNRWIWCHITICGRQMKAQALNPGHTVNILINTFTLNSIFLFKVHSNSTW